MSSIFKPDVPEEPKPDVGRARMKERMRRRKQAGAASTNIVNKPTLGGTNNGS